jgi:hypothetical protein
MVDGARVPTGVDDLVAQRDQVARGERVERPIAPVQSARHGRAQSQTAGRRYSAIVEARSLRSRSLRAMKS